MFKNITDEELQNLINESTSVCEILKKMGISHKGSNHTKLSSYLKNSNLDTSPLVGRRNKKQKSKGTKLKLLSEHLKKGTTANSNYLKKRLFAEGIKEYKCEKCNISEWCGMDIVLELHHINGDHTDNRLENLIILCPNCHSQTSNFRGKNSSLDLELSEISKQTSESKMDFLLKKEENRRVEIFNNKKKYGKIPLNNKEDKPKYFCKNCGSEIKKKGSKFFCSVECYNNYAQKNIPSKDELLGESVNHRSLESLSRKYNVTSNACKKWLKKYGIFEEVKSNLIKKTKSILQYDKNGIFIKEWDSADDIVKELGFNKGHIQLTCNNKQKYSNGFIWKYKNT